MDYYNRRYKYQVIGNHELWAVFASLRISYAGIFELLSFISDTA
jgi:hypothetical protein